MPLVVASFGPFVNGVSQARNTSLTALVSWEILNANSTGVTVA